MFGSKKERKTGWSLNVGNQLLIDNDNDQSWSLNSANISANHNAKKTEVSFWQENSHIVTLSVNEDTCDKIFYKSYPVKKYRTHFPKDKTVNVKSIDGTLWRLNAEQLVSNTQSFNTLTLRFEQFEEKVRVLSYGKLVTELVDSNIDELEHIKSLTLAQKEQKVWLNRQSKVDKKTPPAISSYKNIILTTETFIPETIEHRYGVITAECSYGMNIFKDIFSTVRDIVGGRSKAVQNIIKDSNDVIFDELKKKAYELGANAVIGIDIDYSEFGESQMFLAIGSGTAVKISKK